jgi:alkylation response protein AidB-like acyl-CoA dehydrogenase
MLVRMKIDYDISKLLMYQAAWLKDNNIPAPAEASIYKVFTGKACLRSASDGIQVHGGYGLMTEYKIERSLRDAKLGEVGAGTEQVLNEIIARVITGTRSLTL